MDFHVITPYGRGAELIMQVVDQQLVIVPPPPRAPVPAAGPEQEAPAK